LTPGDDWARFGRSCGAGDRNPEFTLSAGEVITACLAPSAVGDTFADGGLGSSGSMPKVTVWFIDGSRLVHSTVSPTCTTIVRRWNRISDAVWEPAPVVVTISPIPAATSLPFIAVVPANPPEATGICQQYYSLALRLTVIELLIMAQDRGRVENMDHPGHIRVDQTDKFEVPRSRKGHGIGRRRRSTPSSTRRTSEVTHADPSKLEPSGVVPGHPTSTPNIGPYAGGRV